MTTRRANITILIVFGGYILYRLFKPLDPNDTVGNLILNLSIELAGGVLLFGLLNALQNYKKAWFYFQTRLLYRKKEIRLSIAYLYRIKVNDKYLLIKSRTRDYFQPIGGVYKTLPGSEKTLDKLGVRSDRLIETSHGIAKGDLRVHVKGAQAIEFLDWFESQEDRETSPWREFCEELIGTGYLPWQEFRSIDYKYKGRVQTPIITLDSGDKGMFMYDIYDLIPNDIQLPILEQRLNAGNTQNFIWVNEYLINRLGHNEVTKTYEHNISPHTKWAQDLKWSED